MKPQRDCLVDILKGIGIISVVIGHSGLLFPGAYWLQSTKFVYLYHLMIFFFSAGIVFFPSKYENAYVYIGKQMKASFPLYALYNFVFLVLHNFLVYMGIYNADFLSFNNIIIYLCLILTMHYTEGIVGALWFVPMFLISKSIFAIGYKFSEKRKKSFLWHTIIILLTSFVGLYTNHWGMFLTNNLQTAILGVPVIYLGVLFSKFRDRIMCYISKKSMFFCFLILLLVVYSDIGYIELSQNLIINPVLFYPVTIIGIVFCVSLAKLILSNNFLANIVSCLGKHSFHIMALHFVVFKLFDWVWGTIFAVENQVLSQFPFSFDGLGIVYTVLGCFVPVILLHIINLRKANTK